MEKIEDKIKELNFERDKARRYLESLEKNYERKKKFDLMDDEEEVHLRNDIEKMKRDVSSLQRQIYSLESQKVRRDAINKG